MERRCDWYDLRRFTDGKCDTMTEDELAVAWDQCEKAFEQHEKELKHRAIETAWKRLCPPLYRATVLEELPSKDKFEEVQEWKYGRVGLIVLGSSRTGKTRSVWKLLERLHFEGKEIIAFTPMMLKLAVATVWQDTETAEDWICSLHRADVLFFDDLDTVKFTKAVEETIYDVFEHRPTHGKPVIATVNQSGVQLARRMNATGRGVKIVERMREFCQVINFS
jgi:DNA replication protein DnaC